MRVGASSGQGWIDLFDEIQRPALAVVLGDELLQRQAGELLKRAAELIEQDGATLSAEDVAGARSFVRRLSRRIEDHGVKRGLAQVQKRLAAAEGRTVAKVVATLMREGPSVAPAKRNVRQRPRPSSRAGAQLIL